MLLPVLYLFVYSLLDLLTSDLVTSVLHCSNVPAVHGILYVIYLFGVYIDTVLLCLIPSGLLNFISSSPNVPAVHGLL